MVTVKIIIIILVYSNVLTTLSYTCFLILFQSYKTELNSHPALSRSCNVVPELEGAVGEGIVEGVREGTGPTLHPPPTLTLATAMLNPTTLCSIPGGSYFVAPFSSMRIGRTTTLSLQLVLLILLLLLLLLLPPQQKQQKQ